jgi:drug/metabolite transporter (DMT)-like permease
MSSSGISFLLVGAVSFSLLQITIRLSQRRGRNLLAVIAINYLVASLACSIIALLSGTMVVSPFTLGFGILIGILYFAGLILMTISFGHKGVALTSSIIQLAILIPTIMSILIWSENTSVEQTMGIILALLSLPLLSIKESEFNEIRRDMLLTTVALFFINGFAMSSGKILLELGYSDQQIAFYSILFASAFIISALFVLKRRTTPSSADFVYGSIAGACNAMASLGLVTALTTVSGSLVFPLYSSIGLLLTVVLSITVFREKMNKFNVIGIGICLIAVILITSY